MTGMSRQAAFTETEAVREAETVRAVRAKREAAMTAAQRLEHVHELCRQLAAIRLVEEPRNR
jgi:hypothetical protein